MANGALRSASPSDLPLSRLVVAEAQREAQREARSRARKLALASPLSDPHPAIGIRLSLSIRGPTVQKPGRDRVEAPANPQPPPAAPVAPQPQGNAHPRRQPPRHRRMTLAACAVSRQHRVESHRRRPATLAVALLSNRRGPTSGCLPFSPDSLTTASPTPSTVVEEVPSKSSPPSPPKVRCPRHRSSPRPNLPSPCLPSCFVSPGVGARGLELRCRFPLRRL